jgi:2,4-dienoyl-CoA reductase-like NADH-dependent reductase (Old Yellow Enzyme family)
MHGNLVEKETGMNYPHLHTPLTIGPLQLANRLVMPPLVIFKAAEDGGVTPLNREHYAESGGAGYVVVEATAVSPEGRLVVYTARREGATALYVADADGGHAQAITAPTIDRKSVV